LVGWLPSSADWQNVLRIATGGDPSQDKASRFATDLAASGAAIPTIAEDGGVVAQVGDNYIAVYRSDEASNGEIVSLLSILKDWDHAPVDPKTVMRYTVYESGPSTPFSLLNQTTARFGPIQPPSGARVFALIDHATNEIQSAYQPSGSPLLAGFESTAEMNSSYRVLLVPGVRMLLSSAPGSKIENPVQIAAIVKFIALAATDIHRSLRDTAELAAADDADSTSLPILAGPVLSASELERTAAANAFRLDALTIAVMGVYLAITFARVGRSISRR
jgi:hypothetical protein